ncbi:MAG: ribosome biogenesis GTPase YlqF [Oscillospiraceae bacterium]|nr:ribosome biogenesis GTPase YlqF [Oscillospiraceae bacterium]
MDNNNNTGVHIQWYPGHMTKTRRMIEADLKMVDAVAEICDARIPMASRNPDIDAIVGQKPRILVLNRADQADPKYNAAWRAYYKSKGFYVVETDSRSGAGIKNFSAAVQAVLGEKLRSWQEKGQVGRTLKVMVVGVPNVGKSTFINRLAGRVSAKAQDRPGVTRGKQWIRVDNTLELLDTPGILWPKFEDRRVGELLAFTGAVKDDVTDIEGLACRLFEILAVGCPEKVLERYKFTPDPELPGWELLETAGRKRGFIIRGGEVDTERMSRILLDEFRAGKLGKVTLEFPPEEENE